MDTKTKNKQPNKINKQANITSLDSSYDQRADLSTRVGRKTKNVTYFLRFSLSEIQAQGTEDTKENRALERGFSIRMEI